MVRLLVVTVILAALFSGFAAGQEKADAKEKFAAKMAQRVSEAMQKGDWERGIRFADQALKLEPDNGNVLWMRGLGYLKTKKPDKAIDDFTAAMKHEANKAPSLRDRGLAYLDKKDADKAIADLTAFLKLRPEDAEGFGFRADAYELKGEKEKAAADRKNSTELAAKKK